MAFNIALEVDFDGYGAGVLPDILGDRGLAMVLAVRDAGADLRIPPSAWCVSWTGGRSLHFWLTPQEPVKLDAAFEVAVAIWDAVDARIAACGLRVCTAWPTNGTRVKGQLIRLPWGLHRRTGERGRFVDVDANGILNLRDPFPDDAQYLADLEAAMLDPDVLMTAAQIARDREPVRPAQARPRLTVPATAAARDAPQPGERIEVALPQVRRIARPCILDLLERGGPDHFRHDIVLLLRTEAKHCGLTLAETWPVYLRYAAACSPPWEEEDARRDLENNWRAKTDPEKRHLCPGRGAPAPITRWLHATCCIGVDACGWRRAEAALTGWLQHLTPEASAVYLHLCLMETDFSLRPGDGIHTTVADIEERTRLGWRRFRTARQALKDAGLMTWEATGRPDGVGTPGGGRHSIYARRIPVPDPPDG